MTFDVIDGGPADGDVMILLHGFPGGAESWEAVSAFLGQAGYRTIAPDQRGYSPRARPSRIGGYRIDELVLDALALASQVPVDRFHVIGHDWGGIVAWHLAAHHPHRLRTLTAVSTPHPRALAASLTRSPQLLRSWYTLAWQLPILPELALSTGDGALLRTALVQSGLPQRVADRYVDRLLEPRALTAALNWYRAAGRSLARLLDPPDVAVPTLYIWSGNDPAIGRTAADHTANHVTGSYRFVGLDDVSHWIPETAPEVVADEFLRSCASQPAGN
jgi:pimeloyl-ACP methyl ester carboxylesterase